jgi:hypothetical protein
MQYKMSKYAVESFEICTRIFEICTSNLKYASISNELKLGF